MSGWNHAGELWDEIIKVRAENVSPAILGGPDTYTVREINGKVAWYGLRPTALRGVWRWWVRTLIAGLLWDAGFRGYDYQSLARIEARLGLGNVSSENEPNEASRLILTIDSIDISKEPLSMSKFKVDSKYIDNKGRLKTSRIFEDFMNSRNTSYENEPWKVLISIPRYALLITGKDPYKKVPRELYSRQPIPPGAMKLTVTLRSRGSVSDWVKKVCSAALILSLTLGGLGQATSRGFGKMKVDGVGGSSADVGKKVINIITTDEVNAVKKILEILSSDSAKPDLIRMVSRTGTNIRRQTGDGLPPVPTFHPDTMLVKAVKDPKYRGRIGVGRNPWKLMAAIGRACLKAEWKVLARRGYRSPGRNLHTWPLGLPRCITEKGGRVRTGYLLETDGEEPGRLTSLVRITPLLGEHGKTNLIVYAFKTADLKELQSHLKHKRRARDQPVPVSRLGLFDPVARTPTRGIPTAVDYLNIAFKTVVKLLGG